MYSDEEVSHIAMQCPKHEYYHVQSESLLVEVLDDNNRPCAPGQVGRVVITTLHNFAMPLIRYTNEDYAEVGEPCPCWRGLPVIKRILGRRRNMVVGPDGSRSWPQLPTEVWAKIAGIRQIQLHQHDRDDVEVRVESPKPLTDAQQRELGTALQSRMGSHLTFSFNHHDHIPRHANGKFERFICHVAETDNPPR